MSRSRSHEDAVKALEKKATKVAEHSAAEAAEAAGRYTAREDARRHAQTLEGKRTSRFLKHYPHRNQRSRQYAAPPVGSPLTANRYEFSTSALHDIRVAHEGALRHSMFALARAQLGIEPDFKAFACEHTKAQLAAQMRAHLRAVLNAADEIDRRATLTVPERERIDRDANALQACREDDERRERHEQRHEYRGRRH